MEQRETMGRAAIMSQVFVSPYVMLIGAALFWFGNFIVGRAVRGDVPPVSLNFWRWLVALIILLPLSYGQLKQHLPLLKAEWRVIAGLGLTGIAAFHICVYVALTSTMAINALLFLSMAPVAIVIASWLAFRDTINLIQGAGIIVSLLGAVIIIGRGNVETLQQLHFNQGVVAVVFWAIYTILLRHRPAQLPQLAPLTSSVVTGMVWMSPLYLISLAMGQTLTVNGSTIMGVLYIGVFASVLAFMFWNKGVAQLGPNRAGMFIHLIPFSGAVLSVVFLGEGVALYHISGAIFIFSGIALSSQERQTDKS